MKLFARGLNVEGTINAEATLLYMYIPLSCLQASRAWHGWPRTSAATHWKALSFLVRSWGGKCEACGMADRNSFPHMLASPVHLQAPTRCPTSARTLPECASGLV